MLWRAIKSLAALVTLAALVVGIPAALAFLGGNPLHALAHFIEHPLAPDDGSLFFAVFTCVGWVAWASFTLSVVVEIPGAFGRTVKAIPGLSGQQAVAAALLAVIATGTATSNSGGHEHHHGGNSQRWTVVAVAPTNPDTAATQVSDAEDRPGESLTKPAEIGEHLTHQVQRGEALLDLAEHYYGDPADYERILTANVGIPQPDGRTLHPGQTRVYEGWELRIPLPVIADAEPPGTAAQPVAITTELAAYQVRDETVHAIARTPARAASTAVATSATNLPGWAHRAPGGTHRVVPGDTLWDIAERTLGDPYRWPEIYALSQGHQQATGHALRDPGLIRVGWILALPAPAQASAPHEAAPDPAGEHDNASPAPQPEQSNPATEQADPVEPTDAPVTPDAPTPTADAAPGPAAAPGPTATSSGPSTTATPSPNTPPSGEPRPTTDAHPGVTLPGGWLDLGLATAIAAAAALVWAHRRRRYTPRPPSAELRLDDPTVAPMPAVVTQVRRGLHRRATPPPTDGDLAAVSQPDDDEDLIELDDEEPMTPDLPAGPPVTPALANPVMEVWPPAGLGLTGPGAEAAARGFLLAALAAGGLDDPDARSLVVIPSGTLATLLGAAAVTIADTPRLTVTGGLSDALALLEEQTLHRSRVCFDYEVDSVGRLRDIDPMAEPLPPTVLIADATAAHERARIAALLTQGQRLDIHGILLGAWPDGDTVIVAADGATTPADADTIRHGTHPADIGRLAVVDPTETVDVLRVLAESHTGEPQPPAPTERRPAAEPVQATAPSIDTEPEPAPNDEKGPPSPSSDQAESEQQPQPPVEHAAALLTAAPDPDVRPDTAADDIATDDNGGDDPAGPDSEVTDSGDTDAINGNAPGRVDVVVLGAPHVVNVDTSESLRGKALELLVYLAARDGTASQEAILEDLLPEATTKKAPHRLNTYVYNLRTVLKLTGGPATYLDHPRRRYVLNRDAIGIDLWRMRDAITQATATTDPAVRVSALRRAVDAYQGPLAAGKRYEWIEPYREAFRRQAVDATLALADTLTDQPEEALAVLTRAITYSPHAEHLYQAAMRVHAALGDTAAIRDLQRILARRLDEIDAEIGDETRALVGELTAEVNRRARRVSRREGDNA